MEFLSKQVYTEIKIVDLYSSFISRARKINAQVNFYFPTLSITKEGKYIRINFYLKEQNILNKKTIGYTEISIPALTIRVYLTDDFEWVINVDNRMIKKFSTSEVDYIFYKVFDLLP
ncbi:MAG: hypothetical protein ACK4GR_03205 [bacterium]